MLTQWLFWTVLLILEIIEKLSFSVLLCHTISLRQNFLLVGSVSVNLFWNFYSLLLKSWSVFSYVNKSMMYIAAKQACILTVGLLLTSMLCKILSCLVLMLLLMLCSSSSDHAPLIMLCSCSSNHSLLLMLLCTCCSAHAALLMLCSCCSAHAALLRALLPACSRPCYRPWSSWTRLSSGDQMAICVQFHATNWYPVLKASL